jgi:deoxyribodipyrimidine photolyase-related protein
MFMELVPNVYGMGQFADGGIFTTKPYVSGSNYVRKMSDYPKGPWCEIWDGLFWSFIKNFEPSSLIDIDFEKMSRVS